MPEPRMTGPRPRRLDRRVAPVPLPAHLASAAMLWQSSRGALTSLSGAWPPSSGPAAARLRELHAEIARRGTESVGRALDGELRRRAAGFADGLDAYRRHAFRRPPTRAKVMWREGSARLLDFSQVGSGGGNGPPVLLVPSLINRYYVLDLLRGQSFVRDLAARGLRPLVVDWGAPGRAERGFDLTDYVAGRLDAAVVVAREAAGAKLAIVGYCMGGLLALALALRRPADTACLALLATPWDFHAERREQAELLGLGVERVLGPRAAGDDLPVAVIQSLFFALDPFLAERKFRHFATLDPQGEAARMFVALEDWINDGVPLARRVARECAVDWYRDNQPARGIWRVAGTAVEPRAFDRPALVVLPSRDRIVPPGSAAPLAELLPDATVLRPPLGHIGMMAGREAPRTLWPEIADWLLAQTASSG